MFHEHISYVSKHHFSYYLTWLWCLMVHNMHDLQCLNALRNTGVLQLPRTADRMQTGNTYLLPLLTPSTSRRTIQSSWSPDPPLLFDRSEAANRQRPVAEHLARSIGSTCISLVRSVNFSSPGLPSCRRLLQVQHVHARALKATDTTPLELPLARIDSRKLAGQKRWGPPHRHLQCRTARWGSSRSRDVVRGVCVRQVHRAGAALGLSMRLGTLTRCDLGRVHAPGASCQRRVDLLPAMMLMCSSS
jgi:hypothetical protein